MRSCGAHSRRRRARPQGSSAGCGAGTRHLRVLLHHAPGTPAQSDAPGWKPARRESFRGVAARDREEGVTNLMSPAAQGPKAAAPTADPGGWLSSEESVERARATLKELLQLSRTSQRALARASRFFGEGFARLHEP